MKSTAKNNEKKSISISDRATYFYIKNIKKWMFCPACKNGKMTFNKKKLLWTCEDCGYHFSEQYFLNDCVFWFCDECEAYLNNQEGFNKKSAKHICRNCGYENDTTFNNIKGICSDCGKVLPNPDATLCADCRQVRLEKAKEWLKVAAGVAVVVGTAILAASTSDDENENTAYTSLPSGNDNEGEFTMKCANCGNTDENTLWDEDDTVYCSRCCHRTSKETGEDDLVECPYCHRMRDRKAMYCRWCNDSTWQASTQEEFEETDKILKDMGC